MYEFAPRLAAAATRNLRGLVIVPVLAIMVVLPASAQNSSSSEAQSTGTAILVTIDKSRQKMTVFLDGVQKYEWPVSTGRAGYST
ncbi:MAG: L,D-transpeptidase, partial [Pseudolabrys sp.]